MNDLRCDLAIVGEDGMAAVVAATALRRAGISVHTFYSGKEKTQRRKAMNLARETMTIAEAQDLGRP